MSECCQGAPDATTKRCGDCPCGQLPSTFVSIASHEGEQLIGALKDANGLNGDDPLEDIYARAARMMKRQHLLPKREQDKVKRNLLGIGYGVTGGLVGKPGEIFAGEYITGGVAAEEQAKPRGKRDPKKGVSINVQVTHMDALKSYCEQDAEIERKLMEKMRGLPDGMKRSLSITVTGRRLKEPSYGWAKAQLIKYLDEQHGIPRPHGWVQMGMFSTPCGAGWKMEGVFRDPRGPNPNGPRRPLLRVVYDSVACDGLVEHIEEEKWKADRAERIAARKAKLAEKRRVAFTDDANRVYNYE